MEATTPAERHRTSLPGLPGEERESEFHRYLRVLYERRWWMAATLCLGALLFAWWASKQTRIYQASATIVVDAAPPQVMGGDVRDVVQVGPGQYWQMQDYIQTQRRVLVSDRIARRVIERLRLREEVAFWSGAVPESDEAAAHAFIDQVTAEPVPDTQVVSVSFRHRDPAQAKRAVDALVDTYIEGNGSWRDESTQSASAWLAREADDLRQRLRLAELSLYDFKKDNDILSVALEERVNNVGRQIDKLSDALTDARLRRVSRHAEAEELAKMLAEDPSAVIPVAAAPLVEQLKAQLVDEERKLSELLARYEAPHPQVRQQEAKVNAAQNALRRETDRFVRGARARTNEAAEEESRIAAQVETAKQEGMRISRLEIDYNRLRRDADALAKQYQIVLNRDKETELSAKIKVNNLQVLDYARLPTVAVSPRLTRSALAAAVMALVAAALLALLLDSLDRTLRSQLDVESRLGIPVLGMMPRMPGAAGRDLIVSEDPQGPVAESCRVVRTNLMYAGLKRPLRKLLVTSALAREGKTLTSVSLGTVLAQAGGRVLLIDADLRNPRLRRALGLSRDVGVTDVLLGNATLESAIQETSIPNLYALLSGGIPPNPAEVIDSQRFREVLDECAERFDRVLIDSPPVLPVADPAILAAYVDGVVFVIRSGRTGYLQARRARKLLDDIGARVIGAVLNDCRPDGYGYGYGYGYGRGRGSQGERIVEAAGGAKGA